MIVHDYRNSRRGWGHSISMFRTQDEGLTATVLGWGGPVREGDILLCGDCDNRAPYLVEKLSRYRDPKDMWKAHLRFAPNFEEGLPVAPSQHWLDRCWMALRGLFGGEE